MADVIAATPEVKDVPKAIADQILATIYGQCIGDAVGLLTEFMTKQEAKKTYGRKPSNLKYEQKVPDFHRSRWAVGDWTDDTDQMILILQGILFNKGQVLATDFAKRIRRWTRRGYPELGDLGGMGIGATTIKVVHHPDYLEKPQEIAYFIWDHNNRQLAPNGAVMRTSVLGLHQWDNLDEVVKNAMEICKATHHDPRCQASSIAVSSCIALMMQHRAQSLTTEGRKRPLNVDALIQKSYELACSVLEREEEKKELWSYMSCSDIKKLKLDEAGKIGYTYKCMGSGFWALKQNDFKKAIIKLIGQGGDADTNGAVAGSLLACKLGLNSLPQHWVDGLKHKDWLLNFYHKFIKLQSEMSLPIEQRSSNEDLSLESLRKLEVDQEMGKALASA